MPDKKKDFHLFSSVKISSGPDDRFSNVVEKERKLDNFPMRQTLFSNAY